MENWIRQNLSMLSSFPIEDDLIKYFMEIKDDRDLEEYLQNLTGCESPKLKQFITEFKKRKASNPTLNQIGYKKTNNENDTEIKRNRNKKRRGKTNQKQENKQIQQEPIKVEKIEKVEKKKTKFVNLYSEDGKDRTILLQGRHKCDCEAGKHPLINNCLKCGRIVCIQEGAGPCTFCGELVCSLEDQNILSSNTKHSSRLYNKLISQKPSKSLEDSLKQRDKLLDYDRSSSQGTKVIDDECDYYQSDNRWLSTKQREKFQKLEDETQAQKHMSRLSKKLNMTFDFAGREVIEDDAEDTFNNPTDEQIQDIFESVTMDEFNSTNVCPDIEFIAPIYCKPDSSELRETKTLKFSNMKSVIQDKEFLEISDAGSCLSMHQPYASLLVAGIKMHEGRTWYTSHRGRLWIASTVKQPNREEISSIENFYRILKNDKIQFPEHYPTGCLLGCVTVVDVLAQEEYRKVYPDGESESPYVFICENFYSLPIKFPIQGKHKIYKLDKKIHQAALKFLEKTTKNLNSS